MTKQAGFSLLETSIAVMIMLGLAAIAVPRVLDGHIAADEASAMASIQSIHQAQVIYAEAFPTIGFSPNLASLGNDGKACGPPASACLIDPELASGSKDGYQFELQGGQTAGKSYVMLAIPNLPGISGQCSFYSNHSKVIAFSNAEVDAAPRHHIFAELQDHDCASKGSSFL